MNNYTLPNHPLEEQLAAWLESPSELMPYEAEDLERHLATCEQCAALLEQLIEVESGLQALRLARPAPPPDFTVQVMSALPEDLYSRTQAKWLGLGAWARQQVAALAFVLCGVLALVMSGDALTVAAQWWQDTQASLGSASVEDASWLNSLPGSGLETHLVLLPGAILIGIGALMLLVTNLSTTRLQSVQSSPVPVRS
jgi:anti-sigma factor RsiW